MHCNLPNLAPPAKLKNIKH